MGILKRENWWAWLLLGIASSGISIFFLGALLEVYRKDAWYAKWYYWALGIIILLLPAIIMFFIFYIQTLANICKKLEVPGSEIYAYPYAYIICFIVPIPPANCKDCAENSAFPGGSSSLLFRRALKNCPRRLTNTLWGYMMGPTKIPCGGIPALGEEDLCARKSTTSPGCTARRAARRWSG